MRKINAYMEKDNLIIEGLNKSNQIYVYDVDGNVIFKYVTDTTTIMIPVPEKGIFFLRIDDKVLPIKNRELIK